MNTQTRTDRLIAAMISLVHSHGFQLMETYPNDLLIHDRNVLEKYEGHSGILGWCLGDTHTHICTLGIHPNENEAVSHLLNLGSKDLFYKIVLNGSEDFKIVEQTPEQFKNLMHIPIPYTCFGSELSFHCSYKEAPIVQCIIEIKGSFRDRMYVAHLKALKPLSIVEKMAAEYFAYHAIRTHSGTIFFKAESHWENFLSDIGGNNAQSSQDGNICRAHLLS